MIKSSTILMSHTLMAAAGGAGNGLDPWAETLSRLLADEPEPTDVPQALAPMATLGVDVAAV